MVAQNLGLDDITESIESPRPTSSLASGSPVTPSAPVKGEPCAPLVRPRSVAARWLKRREASAERPPSKKRGQSGRGATGRVTWLAGPSELTAADATADHLSDASSEGLDALDSLDTEAMEEDEFEDDPRLNPDVELNYERRGLHRV